MKSGYEKSWVSRNTLVIIITVVTLFICFIILCSVVGIRTIDPGYVGLKIGLLGSRGVDDIQEVTGRVFYNKFTTRVISWPGFNQRYVWTKSKEEGNPLDESISFNSREGAVFNVDMAINVSFNRDKIKILYVKYRREPVDLVKGILRDKVRGVMSRNSSTMDAVKLFGSQKSELLSKTKDICNNEFTSDGFVIESLEFISDFRADKNVTDSINSVIQATQKSIEAENLVKQKEAEARQKIAEASGTATSKVIEAEGAAKAILMKASAEAEANNLIGKSLKENRDLIPYTYAMKWNGTAPQVLGGGNGGIIPMVGLKEEKQEVNK